MEAPPVTPNGVRDGDPVALEALAARRGPGVLAFCREACGPEAAPRAAAEAFARFRAAVHDGVVDGIDPDVLLLGATRHAAAGFADVPTAPGSRLRRRDGACHHVPTLLAARAGGALGDADQERLARHVARCERCREVEAAFGRAEQAYADTDGPLDPATVALLVTALRTAAPVAPEHAARFAHEADGHDPEATNGVAVADEAPPAEEAAPAELPAPEPPPADAPDAAAAELPPASVPPPSPSLPPAPPTDELGETVEWDTIAERAPLRRPLPPAPQPPAMPRREHHHGPVTRVLRVVLPLAVVGTGAAAAFAVAGVFGGNEPTPEAIREAAAAPRLQRPVTTPLPVVVETTPEIAAETPIPGATTPVDPTATTPVTPEATGTTTTP